MGLLSSKDSKMVYKIAVFGSGSGSSNHVEVILKLAFEVGKEIANQRCVLVTGGCSGLPYEAAKGAFSIGGKTVAYSPGIDLNDHKDRFKNPTEAYDKFIFVPKQYGFGIQSSMKYRNVISCDASDGCIIIAGRIGTLNEFTNMYDMGKVIGVLEGSGGVTNYIKEVIKTAGKDTGAVVLYSDDPKILVDKVVSELKSRKMEG